MGLSAFGALEYMMSTGSAPAIAYSAYGFAVVWRDPAPAGLKVVFAMVPEDLLDAIHIRKGNRAGDASFTVPDAHTHALAVNIRRGQMSRLAQTQPQRIHGGIKRPVHGRGQGFEHVAHFVHGQHDRRGDMALHLENAQGLPVALEGFLKKELDAAVADAQRRAAPVQLVFTVEPVLPPPEVHQLAHRAHVRLTAPFCVSRKLEVFVKFC